MQPPLVEGIGERLDDVFLPDDLGEGSRPVFASQSEGHGTAFGAKR